MGRFRKANYIKLLAEKVAKTTKGPRNRYIIKLISGSFDSTTEGYISETHSETMSIDEDYHDQLYLSVTSDEVCSPFAVFGGITIGMKIKSFKISWGVNYSF